MMTTILGRSALAVVTVVSHVATKQGNNKSHSRDLAYLKTDLVQRSKGATETKLRFIDLSSSSQRVGLSYLKARLGSAHSYALFKSIQWIRGTQLNAV